jgi:hypothetical protein
VNDVFDKVLDTLMGMVTATKTFAKCGETFRRLLNKSCPQNLDHRLAKKFNAGLFAIFVEDAEKILDNFWREVFQRAFVNRDQTPFPCHFLRLD